MQQLGHWGCVRDKVTVGMKFDVGEMKTCGVDRDVGINLEDCDVWDLQGD